MFLYFMPLFRQNSWEELLLISRFAAPTSSGILFSMLTAAGLGMTWVFKKVRVLAILDDVDTVILLVPLQLLLGGTRYTLLAILVVVIALLYCCWVFLHKIRLPTSRIWLFFYSLLLASILEAFHLGIAAKIEILLPAFVWGAMLINPHSDLKRYRHEHEYFEPVERSWKLFDYAIKITFMFVVGLLLPKVALGELNPWVTILHVLVVTFLANLGKCFSLFFYKDQATLRERVAVSIGMFPRGEVGAGILVLAIEHGAGGYATSVAGLSLALNLFLTGLFIWIVLRLVPKEAV
ncbi:MAG: hypothetical protein ACKVOH_01045 [Chlamydiales bacterium]